MYNPAQAREFIRALTGSVDNPVHFQCYFDPKKELGLIPGPDAYAEEWFDSFDNSESYIDYKQNALCGVYVCINGTDGEGREEQNIIDLRCFMVDFDGQTEPDWDLTPHLVQMRDEMHGHAFWFIDAGDLENDEWSVIQRRLALYYNTDTQVIDPSRVIRLPGSFHYKNPDQPAVYEIVENNRDSIPNYSVQDILDAHELNAELDAQLNQWAEARKGILEGTGFEYVEREARRFTDFVKHAAYPAVEGSGTHELYRVALYGRDHGLPYEDVTAILWEHYNPRCEPPWDDSQYDHFEGVVFRAYKYAVSAPGCRTFKAQLRELTPLREPECGWDKQAEQFNQEPLFDPSTIEYVNECVYDFGDVEIDRRYRMTKEAGISASGVLTGKSSHYEIAAAFDGMTYDGFNLIRNQRQFYRYQKNHWEIVDDEIVRSQIQRTYSMFNPSNTFTTGVFKVLCDYVTTENVENGKFLDDTTAEQGDLIVFDNCIADLSDPNEIKITSHTPNLFNLTALPHQFNADAQCPTWLRVLNDFWGEHEDLKLQLQQWFGYCLISDVSLEKFAVFKGASRAGKGTITTVLRAMIGEMNCAAPTLDNLAKDSTLEEMATKSLTLIPEAQDLNANTRDAVLAKYKAITGGDPISYHKMYKGSQNSVFKTKIVMSTNNIPHFVDPSGALVNRMLVFPFWKSFEGKGDPTLKEKLLTEIEGITQWAIEGLRSLRANNNVFIESEMSKKEKHEMREDMNPLSLFFSKMCDFDETAESSVEELYSAYRLWALSMGMNKPVHMPRFRQMVKDSHLPVQYLERGLDRVFTGVQIKVDMTNGNVVRGTFGRVDRR